MNKSQFYKYAAYGLLILNLSMIAFFLLTKPPAPPPFGRQNKADFAQRAADLLRLDEKQQDAFWESAKNHAEEMNAIDKEQSELLKPYFNSLLDSNEAQDKGALLDKIQQLERKKIEGTFQHFEEVKAILRTEQEPYFEDFIRDVVRILLLSTPDKNLPPPK